jgi:short-subunit dehydrogenase
MDKSEVWVVGASRGLGWALAREFHGRGRTVVGFARSPPTDPGPFETFELLDVTDARSVESMVRALYRANRRPGLILFLAAQVYQGSLADEPETGLSRALDVNYLGFVRLCRAVAAHKPAGCVTRLVATGSTLGYVGCPSLDTYSASKAALISFARSARNELSTKGVEVLILSPPHMQNAAANGVDLRGPYPYSLSWSARRFADAAQAGRREHVLGAGNRLMVAMSRFTPRLAHAIMHGIGADALKRASL